ncbi:MAG TPA: D-alanyl-D-alanine endopeptidase [Steroidobacteraceae bacterium]|nr:D-alanyl-D-alanine endopeptidase [Steroidobacteraceae bacterium]
MQKLARTLFPLLLAISSLACMAAAPDVRSRSVFVFDRADGRELFAREADQPVPIASITKLMTAMVVLDARQPLDERLKISREDRIRGRGAASRIPFGATLTRADLLRLALMSSENRAAHVLGASYPGGEAAFVRAMNSKAAQLGMNRARFVDPSGLSGGNVASARDVSRLVMAASQYPQIREYSTTERHVVTLGRRQLEFRNTDSLVHDDAWDVAVQKTGYLTEAGKCLALQARILGRDVVIVLLNSWGKYTRVADARRIRKWMESRGSGAALGAARAGG